MDSFARDAKLLVLPTSGPQVQKAGWTTKYHTSVVSQVSDEVLPSSVPERDKDALDCLFRRYARLEHQVGQRILTDKGEADDLVQEVFLYIHRKSALFESSKRSARS